jgi:hypothetical protein
MKIVGKRAVDESGSDPVSDYMRAERLIQEMNRINPFPRPRGFVYKAKSWADYAAWRKAQSNPRLW